MKLCLVALALSLALSGKVSHGETLVAAGIGRSG